MRIIERLRGYKGLEYSICGDEVVFERKIYSRNDYKEKLLADLKEAKSNVCLIIDSFDDKELNEILDQNTNIKIYTKENKFIEHKNIAGLYKTSLEINAIVIDSKILWYGGVNPFKLAKYNDSIMRINDKAISEIVIKEAKKL